MVREHGMFSLFLNCSRNVLVGFFLKSVFLLLGLSVGGASKQLFYNMVRKYTAAATAAAHGYCVHGIVSQFLAGKKETEIETDTHTHIYA